MMSLLRKLLCKDSKPACLMTEEDKAIIHRLAAGDKTARTQAIKIYHAELRHLVEESLHRDIRSINPEMAFMSEVDHPCPDYVLKSMYRKQILEG